MVWGRGVWGRRISRKSILHAPEGAALAADDAPESMPRSDLQREPRGLWGRVGDRDRDDPHPRPQDPLSGPAYLVSHGGAAFPDVEFVLQGEGITLLLDGKTDIKAGITYSRFESAPDAPFTSFETVLPAGPHSALTANVPEQEDFSLCRTTLAMPTEITAQDGALIKQNTPRSPSTGCGAVKANKTRKLTRAQKLAKALKACRKKHNHSRRATCERQAHKQYGPRKPAHKPTHTTP